MYYTISIANLSDRTSLFLYGLEAILKCLILGSLSYFSNYWNIRIILDPKFISREFLLGQMGNIEHVIFLRKTKKKNRLKMRIYQNTK